MERAVLVHDLHMREFGQKFRERIVEPELALLPQLHQRDAGDGLGHREEFDLRIARHRPLGLAVGIAGLAEIDFAPVLPDQGRHARRAPAGDHARERSVDADLIDPDQGWCGGHSGRAGDRRGRDQQARPKRCDDPATHITPLIFYLLCRFG
jgi:hypothetical protein